MRIFLKILIPKTKTKFKRVENKTFDSSTRHHGKCNAQRFSIWEPWWMVPDISAFVKEMGSGDRRYIRVDGHLSSSGRRCNYGFWHRDPASRLRVRHISRIIGCFIKRCHAHVACHSIIHSDIRRYFGVENREGKTDRTYPPPPPPLRFNHTRRFVDQSP